MAHLIPSYFVSKDNLLGEHRIFHLLKNSEELKDYCVFHSLNIINHEKKREGEADFIILGPFGILDIEIKGSNKIIREEGKWTYINKSGSYTASESPFNQAKTNIYSLIKNIKDKNPNLTLDPSKFAGYGVIFPNMVFNEASVEWDKRIVLDENDLDKIGPYILNLYDYWRSKTKYLKGLDLIPEADIVKVRQYLRGNFETIESVRSFLKKNAQKIDQLTVDQANTLDSLSENDRILIKGCAGTGKTFLAIEQCKRIAVNGGKVLFLCFNKLLSKNIYTQLKTFIPNIEVINLDSLFYKILYDNFGQVNIGDINELRNILFESINLPGLKLPVYDYLVIDEGQDILTENIVRVLDKILKNGFKVGCWSVFFDDEVQSNLYAKNDLSTVINEIRKTAVLFTLNTNCRNPRNIMEETKRITKLPIAKYNRLDAGFNNIEILNYGNKIELLDILSKLLNSIVQSGVKPNEITILLPNVDKELIYGLYPKLHIRFDGFIDIANMAKGLTTSGQDLVIPSKCISFSTIQAFKGMENEIIVLAGIEKLETEWENSVLYIGMTRARAKLFILHSKNLNAKFN